MFGHFLELSLTTADIAASVQFYERLGFSQLTTGDTWTHPYGVLSDGRICLGLHQRRAPPSMLSFVRPELSLHVHQLQAAGFEPHYTRLGDSDFHELHPDRRRGGTPKMAPVELAENVFVGDGALILKGVTVGAHSVIGAGSVVTSSVPEGVIVAGNPAKVVREL